MSRKPSTSGTTRGGKATCTANGDLHFPGGEESSFHCSFIKLDGAWRLDGASFGDRSVPR